jgi:hypothetical protein
VKEGGSLTANVGVKEPLLKLGLTEVLNMGGLLTARMGVKSPEMIMG